MLINCVAYEEGTKLADIAVAAIGDYLARPGCFVWVALKDASADELLEMQRQFHLHDLAIEDARHGHQRPKIEEYGDTVFMVMHMIEYTPADGMQVGEVCVFVGPNFVLSVRSHSSRGFLGVRERAEREPHLLRQGASFVFYALMDAVVDRYFPVINAMEDELETVEADTFTPGSARRNIERLYAMKGQVPALPEHFSGVDVATSADLIGLCLGLQLRFPRQLCRGASARRTGPNGRCLWCCPIGNLTSCVPKLRDS